MTALPLTAESTSAEAQPAVPIATSSSDITPAMPAGSNMDTALPLTADSAIAVAQPAEPIAATSSAITPAMPVGSNMVAALPLTLENTTGEVQPIAPIGATSSILAPAMPVGSTMVTAMPMVAGGTMGVTPSTADGTSSSVLAPVAAAMPSGSTIAAGDFLISNLGVVSTNAVIPETSIDARFKYSLTDISQLPKLGNGELVALTQGTSSVTNGRMSYTVPIRLPPTPNDLKPELALSYSSQTNSNGLMGVGWSLSAGGAISRCAKTYATEGALAQVPNPKLTNSDRLCYNGKKLLLRNGLKDDASYWAANAEYLTESESFTLVQRDAASNLFVAYDKKGLRYQFGSKAGDTSNATRAKGTVSTVWALASVTDRYENKYTYTYNSTTESELLLNSIDMATAKVVFTYKSKSRLPTGTAEYDVWDNGDWISRVSTGATSNQSLNNSPYSASTLSSSLLSNVQVFSKAAATNLATGFYNIQYKTSPTTYRDLVDTIVECGYGEGGTEASKTCAKPLTFQWSAGQLGFSAAAAANIVVWDSVGMQDINQDGYMDMVDENGKVCFFDPATGQHKLNQFNQYQLEALPSLPIAEAPPTLKPALIKLNAGYKQLVGGTATDDTLKDFSPVVGDFNNDGRDDFCLAACRTKNSNPASAPSSIKFSAKI